MNEKKTIYQAMFLLDNQEVRQGFNAARDWVKTTLEKHGLDVKVLRLWGERQLAYPIRGRRRATYLFGWLEGSGDSVNKVKREMYLVGPVFRSLFLQEDEIPAEELAFGVEEVDEAALVIPDDEPEDDFEEFAAPEEPAAEEKPAEASQEKPVEASEKKPAETASENKTEDKTEAVSAAAGEGEDKKDA